MNKVIIIFSSHRTLESGGVGTHLRHLINEIEKSEYKHYTILGVKKKLLYKRAFYNMVDSLFHSKSEKNIHYFMNLVFCLSEELKSKLEEISNQHKGTEIVVHCHERQTVFAASLLKEQYNLKIILTLHAPFAEQFEMSHPADPYVRKFAQIIEPGIAMQAENMIAVDALQQQIVENKFSDVKLNIHEIINAVDIGIQVSDKSFVKENYNVDNYIVVARHLNKKNGVEFAIRAYKNLKHRDKYSLFIVGEGADKEQLKALVDELGISDKIFFLGRQPHDISLNIIAHAKLSLVPSIPVGIYIEAASLTMLESMLLETPVVASNIGGLKQVLDHKQTGILLEPEDVETLSKEIDEMLDNEELYKTIQSNAKKLVIDQYSSGKWFQKISAVYNS